MHALSIRTRVRLHRGRAALRRVRDRRLDERDRDALAAGLGAHGHAGDGPHLDVVDGRRGARRREARVVEARADRDPAADLAITVPEEPGCAAASREPPQRRAAPLVRPGACQRALLLRREAWIEVPAASAPRGPPEHGGEVVEPPRGERADGQVAGSGDLAHTFLRVSLRTRASARRRQLSEPRPSSRSVSSMRPGRSGSPRRSSIRA